MLLRLWEYVQRNHYPITTIYLCVMVTVVVVLLLTTNPMGKCN